MQKLLVLWILWVLYNKTNGETFDCEKLFYVFARSFFIESLEKILAHHCYSENNYLKYFWVFWAVWHKGKNSVTNNNLI